MRMSYAAHMASLLEIVWKLHLIAIHEEVTRCGLESLLSIPTFRCATRGREHAQDFLLSFYETFLGKSGNTKSRPAFSSNLFIHRDARAYGRQEFLDEFGKYNPDLEMCPCCDENRLYSKNKATTRTEIDHFLPKAKYPHLACHPYNLVPVCHHCNAITKGDLDPLQGRESLSRNLFPYGGTKLRHYARLAIVFSEETGASANAVELEQVQGFGFKPHKSPPPGKTETEEEKKIRLSEVGDAIKLLEYLYAIPDRWHSMKKTSMQATNELEVDAEARNLQVMLMSETLVRRICQFLGHSERFLGLQERIDSPGDGLRGNSLARVIDNDLRHLLYYLDHDDLGKEPFVFAMTWILADKINGEVALALARGDLSPLGEEIISWFNQNSTTSKQRDEHVERLLKRLNE